MADSVMYAIKMLCLTVLASAAILGLVGAQAACLQYSIEGRLPVSFVDPFFSSWNIDSSRNRAFFDLDLADSRLLYLASQIGNVTIRFGGTGNDLLHYGVPGSAPCRASVPDVYECLNTTWWGNLVALSHASNSSLIAALNIHPYNKSSPPHGPWDPTNAEALLRYAKSMEQHIYALELGNEQNGIMSPQQQAAALHVLNGVLDAVYGSGADRPLLVGPDPHSLHLVDADAVKTVQYLQEYVTATTGILHAVTHHEYIEIDSTNVINATFLDISGELGRLVVSGVRKVAPSLRVWAGEIGPHNGGGSPSHAPNCANNKVCGRYGSTLWYADSMAAKAVAGYAAYFRQDFIGADYGLVNYTSFAPSPDYWMLVLWRRLVGSAVISVSLVRGAPASVRAYCFCGVNIGSMVLILLNLGSSPACLAPPGLAKMTDRSHYVLTAADGTVESVDLLLNGQKLVLDAAGHLPDLTPQTAPASQDITLPPLSLNFIVFDTDADACM